MSEGLEATVTLPDGQAVTGKVTGIGTVTAMTPGSPGAAGGEGQAEVPTIDVSVTVADQAALGDLDAAPVSLALVVAEVCDVLTVPIGALVALSEGGYGVQVVEGEQTQYLPVETGMFADGQVEISGDGIEEGTTVGVPA